MLAVCSLLLSALCLRAELAFKWTVEVSQPLPYAAEALQGESFNLEAKVVQYRVPMLEAAEATFYYQTPEMEASQWYTVPAAWDATTATASVAFTPAMDVGSTKYRFFFGIETAQGKNYRVFGTLRLKASPGFSPATLEPTDVRAEMIQEILEAVFEESDERYATKAEHAALAVQVQGKADAFTVGEGLTLEAGVLSADTPSIFTEPVKIQNGQGTGSLWIGGNVNSGSLTNNQRHLARIVVPTFSDVTKGTTLLGFDSSGDDDMSVANKGYDAVSFGGMKKITNATSPMVIGFCVTKTRGALGANDKVYPMEMDANEVRFNVQPNVNGNTLATTAEVNAAVAAVPKITVDSTLSSTSKNPVQNKVLYSALNNKADKTALNEKASKYVFNSDNYSIPYVKANGASMHALRTVFNANNEADNWAEKFDNAKITFEW